MRRSSRARSRMRQPISASRSDIRVGLGRDLRPDLPPGSQIGNSIPERYGPHTTCVSGFNWWRKAGV
jgi:hypothetical protein